MKTTKCVMGLVVISLVFSCASTKDKLKKSQEKDWQKAQEINKVSAYKDFLRKHSPSPFDDEAKKRIDEGQWKLISSENTIEAYQRYLEYHPYGMYADQAKENIKLLKWSNVKKDDKISGYKEWIKLYPQETENVNYALERINYLECHKKLSSLQSNYEYCKRMCYPVLRTFGCEGNIRFMVEQYNNIDDDCWNRGILNKEEVRQYLDEVKKYGKFPDIIIFK